ILQQQSFELLLLDMVMPGFSGLDLIGRIRNDGFTVPILVFSMHHDVSIVSRAIKVGANGYLGKGAATKELFAAMKKTAEGGRYIDAKMAELLVFMEEGINDDARHKHLSNREFEIFRLLTEGHSVNQIAERLKISNKTVSTHKVHLLEKMRVGNTADLIKYSLRHRLFE
ncbi:MAG: response regulator transcription factor, partial [Methylomonas sp.]|nr:response regulator transcription factor [Methylomonas sp.]